MARRAIQKDLGVIHLILPYGNSRDYGLIALKYNSNRTTD